MGSTNACRCFTGRSSTMGKALVNMSGCRTSTKRTFDARGLTELSCPSQLDRKPVPDNGDRDQPAPPNISVCISARNHMFDFAKPTIPHSNEAACGGVEQPSSCLVLVAPPELTTPPSEAVPAIVYAAYCTAVRTVLVPCSRSSEGRLGPVNLAISRAVCLSRSVPPQPIRLPHRK